MQHRLKTENLGALSWPVFIEELGGSLVFLADAYFLSLISDEVAASIGIIFPVLLLGYFIIPMFSTAGTAVASQYIGANQQQWVVPTYMANVLLSSFLGLLMMIAGFIYAEDVGRWLGMPEPMSFHTSTYLGIVAINFLIVGVRFSYASITASKGLTRWNMATSLFANILNIFLNAVLFFGWFGFPPLGLTGIAIATVISFGLGTLVLILLVHFPLKIRFQWRGIHRKLAHVLRPMIKIGLPSAIEPASYAFQQIVVSLVIVKLGLVAMGANTYVLRVLIFEITFGFALSTGGQILMAHYMGADRFSDVNKLFWKCLKYGGAFAVINVGLFCLISDQLLGIFTENKEILQLGYWMLLVCLIMEPARAVNIIGGMALKGVGDARFSAAISMFFMWAVVPFIFWVGIDWGYGLLGIWICFAIDEIIRAVIIIWRWKTGVWKTKGIKDRTSSGELLPES